jgi:transposase
VWKLVFEQLADDADNEYVMIDATIVRAHQHSAGTKGGGSQTPKRLVAALVGLSTKIHATVDALGNPLSFHLTPGQACDLDCADKLLPNLVADTVLADKAYDADERVLQPLKAQGKTVVIPPKRNCKEQREYDKELYKARQGN